MKLVPTGIGVAVLVLVFASLSGVARAQVIAHPNQLRGQVTFTNVNPVIVSELQAAGLPDQWRWTVNAVSTTPPALAHRSSTSTATRWSSNYELTVESSATGITYDAWIHQSGRSGEDRYVFESKRSPPILWEPAPDAELDFAECAGAVEVRWVDASGAPRPVTGGLLLGSRVIPTTSGRRTDAQAKKVVPAGATSATLLVRGDSRTFRFQAQYTTGTDPFHDLLTHEDARTISVACDEVLVVELRGDGGISGGGSGSGGTGGTGGNGLARLFGTADVLGEDEHAITRTVRTGDRTLVRAAFGPWGNERYDSLAATPSSGAFELENLMPSTVTEPPISYALWASFAFRRGLAFTILNTPWSYLSLAPDQELDLSDTLVIDPGYVRGDLFIAEAPPEPGASAPFEHLVQMVHPGNDPDGDGVPSEANEGLSAVHAYGANPASLLGHGLTSLDGAEDPSLHAFTGTYELVLGGLHRAAADWQLGGLQYQLKNLVPGDWLQTSVIITDRTQGIATIAPGVTIDRPHRYCTSDVDVIYESTSGTFYAPKLTLGSSGSFRGADFEGRHADYSLRFDASGWPAARADAAARGTVRSVLPQGHYVLEPTIEFVNPGGGTSTTALLDVEIDVGCRQHLVVRPEIGIMMSDLPDCMGPGTYTVEGTVYGSSEIAEITWSVNGSDAMVVCSPCGMNPGYSIDVPVPDADAVITVTVTDVDGNTASVSSNSRRGREPSALDVDPTVTPLTVRRDGSELLLDWERIAGATYSAYSGTIDALWDGRYDHARIGADGRACGLADGATRLAMPAQDSYYLVATSCGWGDSSLGRNSFGVERPGAIDRCR